MGDTGVWVFPSSPVSIPSELVEMNRADYSSPFSLKKRRFVDVSPGSNRMVYLKKGQEDWMKHVLAKVEQAQAEMKLQLSTELEARLEQVTAQMKTESEAKLEQVTAQMKTESEAKLEQVKTEWEAKLEQVKTESEAKLEQVTAPMKTGLARTKFELADLKTKCEAGEIWNSIVLGTSPFLGTYDTCRVLLDNYDTWAKAILSENPLLRNLYFDPKAVRKGQVGAFRWLVQVATGAPGGESSAAAAGAGSSAAAAAQACIQSVVMQFQPGCNLGLDVLIGLDNVRACFDDFKGATRSRDVASHPAAMSSKEVTVQLVQAVEQLIDRQLVPAPFCTGHLMDLLKAAVNWHKSKKVPLA